MSDDGCVAACLCGLVLTVITFIFMTVTSPGFLLYGFFSGEWLIEDLSGTPFSTSTGDDKNYYGLYRKCLPDKTCSSYGKTSLVSKFYGA